MKLRFISNNKFKIEEVKTFFSNTGVEIIPVSLKIEELQTEDVKRLVKDKLLKAFKTVGKPTFVEHTGLYIDSLNNLPGGLTQIIWDKLGPIKFANLANQTANNCVFAITTLAYCDGFNVHLFEGKISGNILPEPRGCMDFQWDCIFVPEGYSETFAEMGQKKNEISMRKIAIDQFKMHILNH